MRILIAIAPQMYGQTLAFSLSSSRPASEVLRVTPEELDEELEAFDPQLVICNEVTHKVQALVASWVVLLYVDSMDATACLGGHQSTVENITIEDMLGIVDQVEQIAEAS